MVIIAAIPSLQTCSFCGSRCFRIASHTILHGMQYIRSGWYWRQYTYITIYIIHGICPTLTFRQITRIYIHWNTKKKKKKHNTHTQNTHTHTHTYIHKHTYVDGRTFPDTSVNNESKMRIRLSLFCSFRPHTMQYSIHADHRDYRKSRMCSLSVCDLVGWIFPPFLFTGGMNLAMRH